MSGLLVCCESRHLPWCATGRQHFVVVNLFLLSCLLLCMLVAVLLL